MKKNKFNRKKLAELRKQGGLSLRDLMLYLNEIEPIASKNSIWQWESGLHEPSHRYVRALSKFFKVPADIFDV